jgi:hypothetical protein
MVQGTLRVIYVQRFLLDYSLYSHVAIAWSLDILSAMIYQSAPASSSTPVLNISKPMKTKKMQYPEEENALDHREVLIRYNSSNMITSFYALSC